MYCPDCGHDAGDANFCPECGGKMPVARSRKPRQDGTTADGTRYERPRAVRRAEARRGSARQDSARQAPPRTPVALVWGALALAAVVIVVIVAVSTGGGSGTPTVAAESVTADTSGSYAELVDRANGLYDQGIAAFNANDAEGGVAYFEAAAEVYGAAWAQQPGDPSVGTDYAVSLFYQKHHDEGIKQIDRVLKRNPDFQSAHLNKGIFLQTEASEAADEAAAAEFLAQAKLSFKKAVSIDPSSDAGKHAAEALQAL